MGDILTEYPSATYTIDVREPAGTGWTWTQEAPSALAAVIQLGERMTSGERPESRPSDTRPPSRAYLVMQVTMLGALSVLGAFTDEVAALRMANEAINRKVVPVDIDGAA